MEVQTLEKFFDNWIREMKANPAQVGYLMQWAEEEFRRFGWRKNSSGGVLKTF